MNEETRYDLRDACRMFGKIAFWCLGGLVGWLIFYCLYLGCCRLADWIAG